MADPRFYDNNGPFSLAEICKFISVPLPAGVDGSTQISDVAALSGAGPAHLSFFANSTKPLPRTGAAVCLVSGARRDVPGTVTIPCASVQGAFAIVVSHFYPESGLDFSDNAQPPVHPSARLGKGVRLGHGVVVGANAEIGDGTRLGHNVVIGRGVAIGRNCEIGSNVTISHSYIGDNVLVLPGVQIGQPGFGFASGTSGHVKIPQVGRVIVQDKVEIGACTTIDRGALGDTVVGEGTKIDNLVQIGHNTHIGRHCVIVAQVGISGSCEIGDFVVLGGQAGVADHAQIGDHARIAARGAVAPGFLPGAQDYGGVPVRPLKQWARELAAVAMLARRRKRDGNG